MDSLLQWAERVLFRIGDTPITAGTLVRVVAFAIALVWLSSWLRRWVANRALRHFPSMDLGTREAAAAQAHPRVLQQPAPELLLTSVGPKPTAELAVWHAAHEPSRHDLGAALNAAIVRVLRDVPAPPKAGPAPAPAPRPQEVMR